MSIQDLEVQLRVDSGGRAEPIARFHHDDDKGFRGAVEVYAGLSVRILASLVWVALSLSLVWILVRWRRLVRHCISRSGPHSPPRTPFENINHSQGKAYKNMKQICRDGAVEAAVGARSQPGTSSPGS